MEKLNELVEQAKFVADWHGSDWSSALCQGKDGKQAHEIICESRGEAVISTGSNSNEASWLCDYLELCSPTNILAIAEAFRALEQQRNALAAENAAIKSSVEMHAAGFKICPACSHQDECETDDVVWMVREATPATDAYLNSVRAEGVEMFASKATLEGSTFRIALAGFAAELRAGKDGE
ncbi:hypothetical protein [Pantoea agglomerans]|uniref:hypothetical protein n=1 Tax=Enterobacter agglomerans TaxID=549 RepID=UPI00320ACDA3